MEPCGEPGWSHAGSRDGAMRGAGMEPCGEPGWGHAGSWDGAMRGAGMEPCEIQSSNSLTDSDDLTGKVQLLVLYV